ncbi:DUF6090 family protein [Algoriphagus halophilus]|uniref:Uncharacterized protein n=1 Tax=Algoriphagus halophilus TaxID=226505 RepID=A0A1N6G281_9BACT|nr:DUF6090 family protein [Algoriphagus halophilus]SIO01600.1 hypothetical protein SAMN05444394_2910 [Algoriphagus halophilus]
MISFFRKIRQKLLSQNRVTRYLVYALGEILLVVIGILIALQINNWNESRKDGAYELEMLSEINRELLSEIEDKQSALNIFIMAERSLNELLNMRIDNEYPRDSLEQHLNNLGTVGLFFPYSDGAYEALKSGGVDKIQNEKLRNDLIRLYSYNFKLMSIYVNELARPDMLEKFELFYRVFPQQLTPGPDGVIIESLDYSTFEEVVHTDEFMELIEVGNDVVSSVKPRLQGILRQMNEVQRLVENEISK